LNVSLTRFAYTPIGTFGRLTVPCEGGEFQCYTVELPWRGNKPYVSCIPEAEYSMVLGVYNRGGYPAYEIVDVPGRTYIKIHRGNNVNDLLGCIAPGKGLGYIDGLWSVTRSGAALEEFMAALEGRRIASIKIDFDRGQGLLTPGDGNALGLPEDSS
jgi:hypothetical protein